MPSPTLFYSSPTTANDSSNYSPPEGLDGSVNEPQTRIAKFLHEQLGRKTSFSRFGSKRNKEGFRRNKTLGDSLDTIILENKEFLKTEEEVDPELILKDSHGRLPYEQLLKKVDSVPRWKKEREKNKGKVIGYYKMYEEIGAGNFAKVRLGIHQLTKEKVAIKIIEKARIEPRLEKMLSREVASMEALTHPNLVRLYEVLETPDKLHLVSEYAAYGDLYTKVKSEGTLTEPEAKLIFRQILGAVSFMHANGIIHRDLKAENVFFSTPTEIKVGDMGFSTRACKGQMLTTFCGSPPYAAPELFRDSSYEGVLVDVWALGIILYFIVEGSLPFKGQTIPILKKAILLGTYPEPEDTTEEFVDLLRGILQQKPSMRSSFSEILHHPWLRGTSADSHGKTIPLAVEHKLIQSQQVKPGIPICSSDSFNHLTVYEDKALKILKDLGITNELIERESSLGIHSHIVGIYRMVLHQIQRGETWEPREFMNLFQRPISPLPYPLPLPGLHRNKVGSINGKNGKSTACSIL